MQKTTNGSRKLLIVEDNATLGQYLEDVLLSFDYTVLGPVDTGRAAVAMALEAKPDLILMDVDLRGPMDGIEAARRIRKRRDIPVIYLTAHSEVLLLERAKPTGAMSYLVKPVKTEELFINIEIALHRHTLEKKLRRSEAATQQYAARLEQSNAQLTALNQVALRLQRTRNLDQILPTLGQGLRNLGITCVLTRTDPNDPSRQHVYYTSLPPEALTKVRRRLGTGLVGLAVRPPEELVPADRFFVSMLGKDVLDVFPALDKGALDELLRLLEIDPRGMIFSLPLRVGGRLFGNLVLWGGDLDEGKMGTYQIFASQVAITLENTRLLEAERKARKQAETLQEVATVLNVSLNVEQVLDLILRHVERVIAYDSASMMVVREDRVDVVARRGEKRSPGRKAPESIPVSVLPGIQEVLTSHRPVFIADTRTDPRWVQLVQDYGIRSWMGVPILSGEEVIGVLNLDHNRPGFYSDEDARLAEAFAGQAKLAMENARLFARVQRHAEELEQRVEGRTRDLSALYEVTAAISQHLPLRQVLQRSLQSALKAVDGQAGTVHLEQHSVEQPFMRLEIPKCHPLTSHLPPRSPANNAVREVFASGKGQIASGITPVEGKPYALAATPMRIRGRVLGVLTLFRCFDEPFNWEDVALLSSIGDHMAVAVETVELRRQAEQAAVAAERERLARDLHDSVTQQLYSLTLFAEAVQEEAGAGEVVEEYVAAISTTAQQALREMRLLLYELRAGMFSHDGLVEALRFRLDAVEQRAGLQTRLHAPPALQLSDAVEEGLYRIAQEALNNVLRHAGATAVAVHVRCREGTVQMGIVDNGRGFDPSLVGNGGMGLANMEERASKLGGKLRIDSRIGRGTKVLVIAPIPVAARPGHDDKKHPEQALSTGPLPMEALPQEVGR